MGTKNNPARFDCYANAKPDEPMFILLGRDPVAPAVVALWVALRKALCDNSEGQLEEAKECAVTMAAWARALSKGEKVDEALGLAHAATDTMVR